MNKSDSQLIWLLKGWGPGKKLDYKEILELWYKKVYDFVPVQWDCIHAQLLRIVLDFIQKREPAALLQRISSILTESLPSKDYKKFGFYCRRSECFHNDTDVIQSQCFRLACYLQFQNKNDLEAMGWQSFDPEWINSNES